MREKALFRCGMDKTIRFIADARPDIVDFTIEIKAAQGVNV
jgi:cobalt/nickel transport protein